MSTSIRMTYQQTCIIYTDTHTHRYTISWFYMCIYIYSRMYMYTSYRSIYLSVCLSVYLSIFPLIHPILSYPILSHPILIYRTTTVYTVNSHYISSVILIPSVYHTSTMRRTPPFQTWRHCAQQWHRKFWSRWRWQHNGRWKGLDTEEARKKGNSSIKNGISTI